MDKPHVQNQKYDNDKKSMVRTCDPPMLLIVHHRRRFLLLTTFQNTMTVNKKDGVVASVSFSFVFTRALNLFIAVRPPSHHNKSDAR